MERINQRQEYASKTLNALQEALKLPYGEITRDACILRFQMCIEAVWKFAQIILREREGVDLASPKPVMRHCYKMGILNDEQTELALEMVDDRNLAIHTYNEELAEALYERLQSYVLLLEHLYKGLNNQVTKQ